MAQQPSSTEPPSAQDWAIFTPHGSADEFQLVGRCPPVRWILEVLLYTSTRPNIFYVYEMREAQHVRRGIYSLPAAGGWPQRLAEAPTGATGGGSEEGETW